MKIAKAFMGCANGEIYPREYKAGAECPPELIDAAKFHGALGERKLTKAEQEEAARIATEEAAAKEAAEKAAAAGAPEAN